ncbi:hypothetical protein [Bosea sp. (in: a-proteobacteria)]|uniref:hypothetical protein n=1 Tax=Bosea sp. (in: a-proteobacteria) TaxID=1871050 RepID=UPI002FC77BBC
MNQAVRGVSIADGRMTVDGITGAFVPAAGRPLALEAEGLVLVRGHVWREGVRHEASRIEGRARPREASLHRAGYPGEAHDIALTIRPFPTEAAQAPLLRLGLAGDMAEAGLDQNYRADLFLPQPLFGELRRELAEGPPLRLSLSAATDLWLREAEPEALPGRPLAFHLGLEAKSGRSTSGHGRVETIEWSRAAAAGEHGRLAAADSTAAEEEEPEDPVAEQLRRINWSLKQVLIVLAFLMLIVALK